MLLGTASHLLEALTEQTDQVIFLYDVATNTFSYLNPAFEKIWRKKRKPILSNPESLFKMVHPEDQKHVEQTFQELLEGVIVPDIEFRIKLRNHAERWICVKSQLLEEHGVIAGFANDITAQKQYLDYLKKFSAKKKFYSAYSIARFSRSVGHD